MRIKIIYVLALLISLSIIGCAEVKIPIQVTHHAEINMTTYKQIAIAEIKGNMGQSFSDTFKDSLVESNRFQVVERARLDQLLKELNLSQSDLADETKRVKLGKLLSASAMIAGHTEGKYDEETTYQDATCSSGSKKEGNYRKYSCKNYTRRGEVKTGGSIDVIDIQTGQIIKSKTLNNSCSEKTSATDATPAGIDKDSLFGQCLSKNVSTFLKAIIPWTEVVQASFVKDDAIPDLEKGINQVKMGEMAEAIKIFSNAAKAAETNPAIKPKSIANAYWNLGLAYEYTWEFDKAIELFKKAFSLNADETYIKEKANAESLKAQRRKLQEQEKGT